MAATFEGIQVSSLSDDLEKAKKFPFPVTLSIADEFENLSLRFKQAGTNGPDCLLEVRIYKDTDGSQLGQSSYIITKDGSTMQLQFPNANDLSHFRQLMEGFKNGRNSMFALRTDDSSATQYFQFYGYLSQQQNMMQDYIRTSTYQRAILANIEDFKDKVVLDVGAGSGILSFFAAQAGARKVYAVEASSMAKHAETLVYHNKLAGRVVVIPGKIEEINLPEMVDVIISEPMGYMLFNERMLETYLHAKKWLAADGKMFPSRGDLHIAPFSDASLYMEQLNKANFWYQQSFHGVDLASLRDAAVKEYFRQPIVDTFDINICMAKSLRHTVDFQVAQETDLHRIEIPLSFTLLQTGEVHGLAFWFDVAFFGSTQTVWLSTAPTQPLTHWYQVRCLLDTPLFVQRGQVVLGSVILNSNRSEVVGDLETVNGSTNMSLHPQFQDVNYLLSVFSPNGNRFNRWNNTDHLEICKKGREKGQGAKQSYDVDIELYIEGSSARSSNTLDLKNPFFRYTGQPPQPPPGCNETSPSETYWQTLDAQTAANSANMVVNGITIMNGDTVMDAHPVPQHLPQSHLGVHQTSNLIPLGTLQNAGSNANQRTAMGSRVQASVPTSSIGGGISPSLFTQHQQQVVLGNTSHFPVSNSLMIGDYATPGNIVMPGQIDIMNTFKH